MFQYNCLCLESALNQMMKLLQRKDFALYNNLVCSVAVCVFMCVCIRTYVQ